MKPLAVLTAWRLRQKPRWSIKQLADEIGVSPSAVSQYESGIRQPAEELVPIICRITGISWIKLRPDLAFMVQACKRRRKRKPAAAQPTAS